MTEQVADDDMALIDNIHCHCFIHRNGPVFREIHATVTNIVIFYSLNISYNGHIFQKNDIEAMYELSSSNCSTIVYEKSVPKRKV
jgi:hypothetical protein